MHSSDDFTKSIEKINHLMYIKDTKLCIKNEKELETLVSYSIYQPLRSGRIWHKVNF